MSSNPRRESIEQRSRARRLVIQSLYEWQMNPCDFENITVSDLLNPQKALFDRDYFEDALIQIKNKKDELNQHLNDFSKRKLEALDPVERAILWLAAYELWIRVDIPAVVVINEAIELAKQFGAADSYKFINGVLDKAQHKARPQWPSERESEETEDNSNLDA